MVLNENGRRGIRKKNYRPNFGESREAKNGSAAEREIASGGYMCIKIKTARESHDLGLICLLLCCGS